MNNIKQQQYNAIIEDFFKQCNKRIKMESHMLLSDIFDINNLKENPKDKEYENIVFTNNNYAYNQRINNLKKDLFYIYGDCIRSLLIGKGYIFKDEQIYEIKDHSIRLNCTFDDIKHTFLIVKCNEETRYYFTKNKEDVTKVSRHSFSPRKTDCEILSGILTSDASNITIILVPSVNLFEFPYVFEDEIKQRLASLSRCKTTKSSTSSTIKNAGNIPLDNVTVTSSLMYFVNQYKVEEKYIYEQYVNSFSNLKYLQYQNLGELIDSNFDICIDLIKRKSNILSGSRYKCNMLDFKWKKMLQDYYRIWDIRYPLEYLCYVPEDFNLYYTNKYYNLLLNFFDDYRSLSWDDFEILLDNYDLLIKEADKKLLLDSSEIESYYSDNPIFIDIADVANQNISYLEDKEIINYLITSEYIIELSSITSCIDNSYVILNYDKAITKLLYNVLVSLEYAIANPSDINELIIDLTYINDNQPYLNELLRCLKAWKNNITDKISKQVNNNIDIYKIRKYAYKIIYMILGILINENKANS